MSREPRLVDARGLLCPWPVVRLARIARENGVGPVRILADDPIASGEIEQLCAERGWGFARDPEDPVAFNVLVR